MTRTCCQRCSESELEEQVRKLKDELKKANQKAEEAAKQITNLKSELDAAKADLSYYRGQHDKLGCMLVASSYQVRALEERCCSCSQARRLTYG